MLQAAAKDFEAHTPATNVRVYVTLPTGSGRQTIAYRYGFADDDPDKELELELHEGCMGVAWTRHQQVGVDLLEETDLDCMKEHKERIRLDRKTVFSTPMFERSDSTQNPWDVDLIGIFSVDTDKSYGSTKWWTQQVSEMGKRWAWVLSRILD